MARPTQRKLAGSKASSAAAAASSSSPSSGEPPKPFRTLPPGLEEFVPYLSRSHVYLTHVDTYPASFKRKIFMVPVALNVFIVLVFAWWWLRVQGPWYLDLVASFTGIHNDTTIVAADESVSDLARIVLVRGLWFLVDMLLFVFVWPWPLEFFVGTGPGASPATWRWTVGFREREVVVRRSREWDRKILKAGKRGHHQALDFLKNEGDGSLAKGELLNRLQLAASPRLVKEKTGYLTLDGNWDLAWDAMVAAHRLVDKKEIAMEAFNIVALVHHDLHGWLVVDLDGSPGAGGAEGKLQEQRRDDVFRFREALVAVGKEDLFYRWIELVQFESTRPDGFGKERQEMVAQQVRDLFSDQGVDFDKFWLETVGK